MNKVVLVTGSSRGIGAATIKEFASNGYDVVINYIEEENKALELKEEVEKQFKIKALVINCDVSNETEVKNMTDEIINEFGHIDVLVNNAGIAVDSLFEDKTIENFKRTLEVNLIGQFLVSKYVGSHMLANEKGSIINISSTNGINTYYPYSLDYDASKAGVISLTHNLAIQFSPYVRVNAVAPGWVNTDMNKDLSDEHVCEEQEKILLKRFAEPNEIAKVIYFLAIDESSYINSSVIRVDGGLSA
jgi:3-oxoacyl-[acyl-carrier protein] reductase